MFSAVLRNREKFISINLWVRKSICIHNKKYIQVRIRLSYSSLPCHMTPIPTGRGVAVIKRPTGQPGNAGAHRGAGGLLSLYRVGE